MTLFSRILVPTDFSDGAERALDRALELRAQLGGSVTLFHAYQFPIVYSEGFMFSPDLLSSIEAAAREQLETTRAHAEKRARALAGAGPVPEIAAKLNLGTPAIAVVDEAQRGGYDLIVMGTHGRTGIKHLLIGSVAERVVRTAPCAVLTIR